MSKKQLLTESEIRRFMKLANLEPLAKNVVREGYAQQDEGMPPSATDEQKMMEAGLSGDDSPPEAVEKQPMDDSEGGEESEEGEVEITPELKKEIEEFIKQKLGGKDISIEIDADESEDEEDMDMEMSDEGDDEGEEEEEEEEEEEKEEMDETLSEDALVETVLARVTARLVSEAAKKKKKNKMPPALKKAMEEKKAGKKPAAKKESLQLNGDKLEEATSAEGGGPLLKQGKNKYDVYKGHADMTMAKGDKGGKGGHSLETLSAKAEHTVTHGGKNLATLGGNKKKV